MKTSLQVILTAISIAVAASPVMVAQSLTTRPYVEESAPHISNPHGPAASALVAIGTRVAGWTHQDRLCRDCVPRIEP
jgi:hypothetical protein